MYIFVTLLFTYFAGNSFCRLHLEFIISKYYAPCLILFLWLCWIENLNHFESFKVSRGDSLLNFFLFLKKMSFATLLAFRFIYKETRIKDGDIWILSLQSRIAKILCCYIFMKRFQCLLLKRMRACEILWVYPVSFFAFLSKPLEVWLHGDYIKHSCV